MRWTKRDWEFIVDELDEAIARFIPRMTHDQIRTLVDESLERTERAYQDWLSLPDV